MKCAICGEPEIAFVLSKGNWTVAKHPVNMKRKKITGIVCGSCVQDLLRNAASDIPWDGKPKPRFRRTK